MLSGLVQFFIAIDSNVGCLRGRHQDWAVWALAFEDSTGDWKECNDDDDFMSAKRQAFSCSSWVTRLQIGHAGETRS